MHQEHGDDGHVAEDDELAQVEDGGVIAGGRDVGDKGEHTVGGKAHDHLHDAHDDAVQAVDKVAEELRLFGIAVAQLQVGQAHDGGEDDHGDGGRGARAGKVGEHVDGDHGQDGLRDGGIGDLVLTRLKRVELGGIDAALREVRPGKARQGDGSPTEQRRDGHRDQKDGEHRSADLAQVVNGLRARERADDGHEHQRHDQHAQKIDVAGSHQRHPIERSGGGIAAAAQRQLDARAQHDAQPQGREHAEREAFILRLQIAQHRDERHEDDQHGEHRPQYVERHVSRLPFSFRSDATGGRTAGKTKPGNIHPPVAAPAYSVSLIMRLLYLVVQWAYYAIFRRPAIGQSACKRAARCKPRIRQRANAW